MQENVGKIWVFDQGKLNDAIAQYEEAALAAYPAQSERIRTTVLAIRDFLESDYAEKLTLSIRMHDDSKTRKQG